jgi:large subunit ribosomal protein L32e
MADPEKKEPAAEPEPETKAAPTPKKADTKPKRKDEPATEAAAKPAKKAETPKAPRRPSLDPEVARLLSVRRTLSDARPLFVRQAAHRYWRIGRDDVWRRPRGLQSKQRRHYGYRSRIVRIGYGSPAATRGLTPTGFLPVIVRTTDEIARLDTAKEAAVIARTVGTRRRLVLEEVARKRGVHVLNPITKEREET